MNLENIYIVRFHTQIFVLQFRDTIKKNKVTSPFLQERKGKEENHHLAKFHSPKDNKKEVYFEVMAFHDDKKLFFTSTQDFEYSIAVTEQKCLIYKYTKQQILISK